MCVYVLRVLCYVHVCCVYMYVIVLHVLLYVLCVCVVYCVYMYVMYVCCVYVRVICVYVYVMCVVCACYMCMYMLCVLYVYVIYVLCMLSVMCVICVCICYVCIHVSKRTHAIACMWKPEDTLMCQSLTSTMFETESLLFATVYASLTNQLPGIVPVSHVTPGAPGL